MNDKLCVSNAFLEGPPKKWRFLDNTNTWEELSKVNPNYKFDFGFRRNCVNCVIAYELRLRGYDVITKSRDSCNVSNKAALLWEKTEIHYANTIDELLKSLDLTVDARYFLGYVVKQEAHAMMLLVLDKNVFFADPQINKLVTVDYYKKSGISFEFWRIDNLEITQTGYNACEGVNL